MDAQEERLYSTRSYWRIFIKCCDQRGRTKYRDIIVKDEQYEDACTVRDMLVRRALDELGAGSVPTQVEITRIDGRKSCYEAIDAVGFDRREK